LDNYRAIAISNALWKLFEAVIAQNYLQSDSDFDTTLRSPCGMIRPSVSVDCNVVTPYPKG